MLNTPLDVAVWAIIALPLWLLAIVGCRLLYIRHEQYRHERYMRFHAIMAQLANKEGTTADKIVAAHELRHYKEYGHIIAKLFESGRISEDREAVVNTLRASLALIKKS